MYRVVLQKEPKDDLNKWSCCYTSHMIIAGDKPICNCYKLSQCPCHGLESSLLVLSSKPLKCSSSLIESSLGMKCILMADDNI